MEQFTPVFTNNLHHVLKNMVQVRDHLREADGDLRMIRKLNLSIDFVKEALNEDGPMPHAGDGEVERLREQVEELQQENENLAGDNMSLNQVFHERNAARVDAQREKPRAETAESALALAQAQVGAKFTRTEIVGIIIDAESEAQNDRRDDDNRSMEECIADALIKSGVVVEKGK